MGGGSGIVNSRLLGFLPEPITVPLAQLLPSRKPPPDLFGSRKFNQIEASIREVGLIEPLTVRKPAPDATHYLILDGHVRCIALQRLGYADALCLTAVDDEAYTYNKRVNRLSTIQEHIMLRRAIDRGVSPERIAAALNVDISHISKKMKLLDGICDEAAELLKDHTFSPNICGHLRRLKPARQIECVELMIAANRVSSTYAMALLAATPAHMLVSERKPRRVGKLSAEQMARMEKEMENLHGRFKAIEQSYGQDVLNLVLAKGYLQKLLGNKAVQAHLQRRQPDLLLEFTSIVEVNGLDK